MTPASPADDGWWKATDGNWYPPDHPRQPFDPRSASEPLGAEWWYAADGRWYPPDMRPPSEVPRPVAEQIVSESPAETSKSQAPDRGRTPTRSARIALGIAVAALLAVLGGFGIGKLTDSGLGEQARLASTAPATVTSTSTPTTSESTQPPTTTTSAPPPPTTPTLPAPPPPPPTTQPPLTFPTTTSLPVSATEYRFLSALTLLDDDSFVQSNAISTGYQLCDSIGGLVDAWSFLSDPNARRQLAANSIATALGQSGGGIAGYRLTVEAGNYLCPQYADIVNDAFA
jgi:hypothetical protein